MIELARDAKLVLLELGETADHKGVLEVRRDHLLEELHVVCAELAEALVHQAAEIAVTVATVVLKQVNRHHIKERSARARKGRERKRSETRMSVITRLVIFYEWYMIESSLC